MSKLKKRIYKLKKFELLLKRITYSIFHKTHPIFRKKDYLLNLFKEKALKYNIEALNFKEGIVLGEFQDKNYLIHCQPGNLLESTIFIEKIWEEHLIKIMSLYLNGGSGIMIDVGSNETKGHGIEPGDGYQGIKIMSMDMLLKTADTPVMWTEEADATAVWVSTMESTAIRELLADTNWGELDYLLVDMPPGSDRIDNIRSLIPELAGVIEITIPSMLSQHIVTKSITKNNKMGVPIIGLVENMATYVCPHCDKEGKLFAGEDVQKLTERKEISYIGKIPFDTRVSQSKSGNLFYKEFKNSITGKSIAETVDNIEIFIKK